MDQSIQQIVMAIDISSFIAGSVFTAAVLAIAILIYSAVRASRRASLALSNLPRVTTATDAFFGLINKCQSLEKLVKAQAGELGRDPVLPDSPETWAVRKTIKDPPWLDLTVPRQNRRYN